MWAILHELVWMSGIKMSTKNNIEFVYIYIYGPWKMERDLRVNFVIFQKS